MITEEDMDIIIDAFEAFCKRYKVSGVGNFARVKATDTGTAGKSLSVSCIDGSLNDDECYSLMAGFVRSLRSFADKFASSGVSGEDAKEFKSQAIPNMRKDP